MTIETKLNVGDSAFILFSNKVFEVEIEEVSTSTRIYSGMFSTKDETRIKYNVIKNPAGSQYTKTFGEDEIFKTKQELLDTL